VRTGEAATAAPEAARGEVGIKHWNFAANSDVFLKKLVHAFLDVVGGLPYLADGERANEIATLLGIGRTSRAGPASNGVLIYDELIAPGRAQRPAQSAPAMSCEGRAVVPLPVTPDIDRVTAGPWTTWCASRSSI
jgi:hypothetical protein